MTNPTETNQTVGLTEWTAEGCRACLEQQRPKIGNFGLFWKLLRWEADRRNGFPDNLFGRLRRLVNPNRPYFIGKTWDGVRFLGDARDFPSAAYMVLPRWNEPVVNFIRQEMGNVKGSYVDLGANFGVVAASVARAQTEDREIIAVEPVPETAGRAAATFALNHMTNVRLVQAAVGAEDGLVSFFASAGNSAIATVHKHEFQRLGEWREQEIPMRRLDTLLADTHTKVGFIKLDVEGNELSALRGATNILTRDNPAVLFEFTPALSEQYGYTVDDVLDVIRPCGSYQFIVLHDSGELTRLPPKKGWDDQVNIYGWCEG